MKVRLDRVMFLDLGEMTVEEACQSTQAVPKVRAPRSRAPPRPASRPAAPTAQLGRGAGGSGRLQLSASCMPLQPLPLMAGPHQAGPHQVPDRSDPVSFHTTCSSRPPRTGSPPTCLTPGAGGRCLCASELAL